VAQLNPTFVCRVAHIVEEVFAPCADHPAQFLARFGRHQQRDRRTDETPDKDPDQKAKHAFHGNSPRVFSSLRDPEGVEEISNTVREIASLAEERSLAMTVFYEFYYRRKTRFVE